LPAAIYDEVAMVMFCVRVPDNQAERFDQAAYLAGGRSVVLRRLIVDWAAGPRPATVPARRFATEARVMVRLSAPDAAALDQEVAILGMRRASWIASLVRRRLRGRPSLERREELAVFAVQGELRRIGVNINQIARALNTAVLEGRVLDLELDEVRALGREIRAHMTAIGEAFAGNLAYWETDA